MLSMKYAALSGLDILSRLVLAVFVLSIIVSTIATVSLRYYLPRIDSYREEILSTINQNTQGLVVSAAEIESHWQPFHPAFALKHVSVKHPHWEKALQLDYLGFEVDFVRSLMQQRLTFSRIELQRLKLLFTEDDNHQWNLAGFNSREPGAFSLKDLTDHLWAVETIDLDSIDIQLKAYDEPLVSLPSLHVSMLSAGEEKRFEASIQRQNRQLSQLSVITDQKPFSTDFSASIYWRLNHYPLAELWALLNFESALKSAAVDAELWLQWRDQQATVKADAVLKDLLLEFPALIKEQDKDVFRKIDIDKAQFSFLLEYQDSRFDLWMPTLLVSQAEQHFTLDRLAIQKTEDLTFEVGSVALAPLSHLLMQLPIADTAREALSSLDPQGELRSLMLAVDFNQEAWDFSLKSDLHSVSVKAYEGAPVLNNVNGQLQASKYSGEVLLDTHDFTLAFPNLYDNSMQFAQANGVIDWTIESDNVFVRGEDIRLSGLYGLAQGGFHLQLPLGNRSGRVSRLALDVGFENVDVGYRHHFIPKTLSPELLAWLDESIRAGQVTEGGFIFHGPISDPVFEDQQRARSFIEESKAVQLWLNIEDGELHYLSPWPLLSEINGELLLDNNEVQANVHQARLTDFDLQGIKLSLLPKKRGQQLIINGQAKSSAEATLAFLRRPLFDDKLAFLKNWQTKKGRISADVDVSMLIENPNDSLNINVAADVINTNLRLPDIDLSLTRIHGPLNFNLKKGLSSDGLRAKVFDETMSAVIRSNNDGGKLSTTIDFNTKINVKDLVQWTGQPGLNLLSGSTMLEGQLFFSSENANLELSSDMKGMGFDLPEPFFKQASDSREFSLQWPLLVSKHDTAELLVNMGSAVEIRFLLDDKGFSAGQINLGLKKGAYQKRKIIVAGQLTTVDAEQWWDVFERYTEYSEGAESHLSSSSSPASLSDWAIEVENLHVRQLNAFGHQLQRSTLDIFDTSSYVQLAIRHPQLDGRVRVFQKEQPLHIDLTHIDVSFLMESQQDKKAVEEQSKTFSALVDPKIADLPDMNVEINRLHWGEDDYGEWSFKLRSQAQQIVLNDLQANVKHLQLMGADTQGASLRWSLGEMPTTTFSGRFKADNLADVLTAWGYQQEIISETAQFDIQAQWPGGPDDLTLNNAVGDAKINWRNGSFADVSESQTSALKIASFLNVGLLVDRLQLDFSDLSSKGLVYDTVDGQVFFEQGVFTLKEELDVKAPSSEIQLKGWADLNTDTIDMAMGVTLPIASNLPWIVALAAGLPAAAGVYIVGKLLKKQVSTLFSAIYSVKGDLSDPKVQFERLFDTGLPDIESNQGTDDNKSSGKEHAMSE